MKDMFKEFYNPTENQLKQAWGSSNTLFIFDTNILLNLYGYKKQTRDDFIKLMRALGDRVWIPYHVALEYQQGRLSVIKNEKKLFSNFKKEALDIEESIKKSFKDLNEKNFPELHSKTSELKNKITELIDSHIKYITEIDRQQPCVRSDDKIRSELDALFSGKVGAKPESNEALDEIYKDGEIRYSKEIPPGYKDKSKDNDKKSEFIFDELTYKRKYGDLIIWHQIIEKAKSEVVVGVIFITDDAKEDWWHIVDSQGNKQIGPHPLLRGELFRKANIKLFHMYSADLFLTDGKSYLTSEIQESSITDAKEVAADSIQINSKLSANEDRSTTRVNHEQDAISQYEMATSLGLEPDWNMDLDRLEVHRQALEHGRVFEDVFNYKSAVDAALEHGHVFDEMLKYKSAVDVALEYERAFYEIFKHKSAVDVAFERERALEGMLKHRRVFRRPK